MSAGSQDRFEGRGGSLIQQMKIPNFKQQITNKSQVPILNIQNVWSAGGGLVIVICLKFVICDL
jgi:hypothetical protein